jgi:hypothetical protein
MVTRRGCLRCDHLSRNLDDVVGRLRSRRLLVEESTEPERLSRRSILLHRGLE